MASAWKYSRDGQQNGPVSSAELKQLAASSQLLPTDLLWKEGMAAWVPASKLKGLFPEANAAVDLPSSIAAKTPPISRPMQKEPPVVPPKPRSGPPPFPLTQERPNPRPPVFSTPLKIAVGGIAAVVLVSVAIAIKIAVSAFQGKPQHEATVPQATTPPVAMATHTASAPNAVSQHQPAVSQPSTSPVAIATHAGSAPYAVSQHQPSVSQPSTPPVAIATHTGSTPERVRQSQAPVPEATTPPVAIATHPGSSVALIPLDDYTKGPVGQKIESREGIDEDDKLPFTESGFFSGLDHKSFFKHGLTITWYEHPNGTSHGIKKSAVCFFNGKPHGPTTTWYSDGKVKARYQFRQGEIYGKYSRWNESGNILFTFDCTDRKLPDFDSLDYTRGPQGQKLQIDKGFSILDPKTQTWTEAEPDGRKQGLSRTCTFYDDRYHGKLAWTNETGPTSTNADLFEVVKGCILRGRGEQYFFGGLMHGPLRTWHENGQKWVEMTFVDNVPWGPAKVWNENGILAGEVCFLEGSRDGPSEEFYPNGKVWLKGGFKQNARSGIWTEWDDAGNKLGELEYVDGKVQQFTPADPRSSYAFIRHVAMLEQVETWSQGTALATPGIEWASVACASGSGHENVPLSVWYSKVGRPDQIDVIETGGWDIEAWTYQLSDGVFATCRMSLPGRLNGIRVRETVGLSAPGVFISHGKLHFSSITAWPELENP